MTRYTAARLAAIPSLTGSSPPFDLSCLPTDPVPLFFDWLDVALAAGVPEPRAMTLATVDASGNPNARTLIVKDVDERGWAFAGPRVSAKSVELAACPVAALNFWWQPLIRAIRVTGPVLEASRTDSEADLAARLPGTREDIDTGGWVLWRLQPERVEFWQGSSDRHHTQAIYRLVDDVWTIDST